MIDTDVSGNLRREGNGGAAVTNSGQAAHAMFTIGELARDFGVSLRTLRFYEERKLLAPNRQGSRRFYSRRDRARLELVLLGKKVGLSLTEIRDLLDFYDLKRGHASQLRLAISRFGSQIERLRRQREDVDQAISALTRTRERVSGMLRERERGDEVAQAAE